MILDGYYHSLRRLLAEGDPGARITRIGFGEGTAEVAVTDAALTNPYIKPLSGTAFDPVNARLLRLDWLLRRDEANGMAITELGLLTDDGVLVARKVRDPINKTPDMEFGDSWEILV